MHRILHSSRYLSLLVSHLQSLNQVTQYFMHAFKYSNFTTFLILHSFLWRWLSAVKDEQNWRYFSSFDDSQSYTHISSVFRALDKLRSLNFRRNQKIWFYRNAAKVMFHRRWVLLCAKFVCLRQKKSNSMLFVVFSWFVYHIVQVSFCSCSLFRTLSAFSNDWFDVS